MISKLGTVVEIKRHCGWTGNVETSWQTVSAAASNSSSYSKVLADIDGSDSVLYWVDLTTEIAFYLPHQFLGASHPLIVRCLSHAFTLVDQQSSEMRIVIVWLEEFCSDLDSLLPGLSKCTNLPVVTGL